MVFTDRTLKEDEFHLIPHIFPFLVLANPPEEFTRQIGMIYEYVDQAGPRTFSQDGSRPMPIFFSAKFLNHNDSFRVARLFFALKKTGEDSLDGALEKANQEIQEHEQNHVLETGVKNENGT
jgi:hypothetical protein